MSAFIYLRKQNVITTYSLQSINHKYVTKKAKIAISPMLLFGLKIIIFLILGSQQLDMAGLKYFKFNLFAKIMK
jgi:hypothetical protein